MSHASSTRRRRYRAAMIDFSEFKAQINATQITPELLGEVMVMVAALPSPERDDFEARAMRVVGLVEMKRPGDGSGMVAMAITIRLMALDAIIDDHLVRKWLIPGPEPKITYVHADLLRAAAAEPVIEGPEGQPIFAIASFCERLALVASSRGRA